MKITYLVIAAASLAIGIDSASAQPRPQRPYRGLFASGGSTDAVHVLTSNSSVGTGYNTSALAEASDEVAGTDGPLAASQNAGYLRFSEDISYAMNKERVTIGANGSLAASYYPTIGNDFVTSFAGGFGATWAPTARTDFSVSQSVSYHPYSMYSLFPEVGTATLGQPLVPDLDYSSIGNRYWSFGTSVSASRQLSARSSISGSFAHSRSEFASLSLNPDFTSQTGSVRFTQSLNAGLALRLGYGYTSAEHGVDQTQTGQHLIDTGVDFSRTLSFSRRTKLSFSTGGSATSDRGNTYFNVIGTAVLDREIGRSWNFNAAYNRSVGFVEMFLAPVMYDSVNVTFGGLIERSLSFQSGGGVVRGNVGFSDQSGTAFNSYYATASLARALTRFLSLSVDYAFYRDDFQDNVQLPTLLPGFSRDVNRHSVRASVNAWVPLLQLGRRPNASR
jgi:hypothetical protein